MNMQVVLDFMKIFRYQWSLESAGCMDELNTQRGRRKILWSTKIKILVISINLRKCHLQRDVAIDDEGLQILEHAWRFMVQFLLWQGLCCFWAAVPIMPPHTLAELWQQSQHASLELQWDNVHFFHG